VGTAHVLEKSPNVTAPLDTNPNSNTTSIKDEISASTKSYETHTSVGEDICTDSEPKSQLNSDPPLETFQLASPNAETHATASTSTDNPTSQAQPSTFSSPSATLDTTFSPFPSSLDSQDLAYLHDNFALTLPASPLRLALLQAFVEYVFQQLPILDEQQLGAITSFASGAGNIHGVARTPETSKQAARPIPLILYQSALFAALPYVPAQALHNAGYATLSAAQTAIGKRVRLLFNFKTCTDNVAVAKALLFMALGFMSRIGADRKDNGEGRKAGKWLELAVKRLNSMGGRLQNSTNAADHVGVDIDIDCDEEGSCASTSEDDGSDMESHIEPTINKQSTYRLLFWAAYVLDRDLVAATRMCRGIKLDDCASIDKVRIDDFGLPGGNCSDMNDASARKWQYARAFVQKANRYWLKDIGAFSVEGVTGLTNGYKHKATPLQPQPPLGPVPQPHENSHLDGNLDLEYLPGIQTHLYHAQAGDEELCDYYNTFHSALASSSYATSNSSNTLSSATEARSPASIGSSPLQADMDLLLGTPLQLNDVDFPNMIEGQKGTLADLETHVVDGDTQYQDLMDFIEQGLSAQSSSYVCPSTVTGPQASQAATSDSDLRNSPPSISFDMLEQDRQVSQWFGSDMLGGEWNANVENWLVCPSPLDASAEAAMAG
jgi:hypothetical protein